ncbi:MAG: efflux RND transporter periplasmic adaptor subunit [Bacteroidia bacterium]|nr:efflux RND transporter periplasmic adaptor subunit [Bacteroidia bacterium]
MKKILIGAGIIGAFLQIGCAGEKVEKEESTKFLITNPIQKDTTVIKDYVCQIHAISHIEIRSQEKGYLQDIYVDEGQLVKKGQLMFRIMPVVYQAEMEKAQANVNYAEIEYKNTKALADSNIVSKNELALAKARLDKEKAELALSQAHLSFTEIRAPFDGIMDRFYQRLGSLVDEGELLTTLSDNSKMWVYFNVPEAEYLDYAARSGKGDAKQVKLLMANNQLFNQTGTIETIEADFNNETGTIAFRATFQNPEQILRHGETGSIEMPIVLKKSMLIPQEATFEILDKKYVYVVDDKGTVQSREISVAQELPHLYAISGGLKTTDKVLIEGIRKVKNGQQIKTGFESMNTLLADLNHLHAE